MDLNCESVLFVALVQWHESVLSDNNTDDTRMKKDYDAITNLWANMYRINTSVRWIRVVCNICEAGT